MTANVAIESGDDDGSKGVRARFRAVLADRDFRLIITSSALSEFGDWLYNVALLVFVFDATGSSAWVAAATVIRLVPVLLLSPIGGAVAERHPVRTVIVVSGLVRGTLMTAIALVAAIGGPPVVVLALVALATTAGTVDLPALSKATPQYVTETNLASANALVYAVTSTALVLGPAVSGLVLLVGPPWVAFAINAATFFASSVIMQRLPRPAGGDATIDDGERASVLGQVRAGARVLRRTPSAALIVATVPLLSALYGASTVLFVLLSTEVYGTGDSGVGWLYASLGLGGLLFTGPAARIADSRRPALGIAGTSIAAGAFMASLGLTDSLAVAFVLVLVHSMVFIGGDVVSETVLQRILPSEALGRVFGLIGSVAVLGMVAGAMVVPPLVGVLGVRAGTAVVGLVPVAVFALLVPRFAAIDRETADRRVGMEPFLVLLRRLAAFADSAPSALEVLATSGERIDVAEATTVITEGDPADFFYVVVEGELVVTTGGVEGDGRVVATLGAGDSFGEIGLLRRSPRTASVTTTSAAVLHRYPGSAFVAAVEADAVAGRVFERGAQLALSVSHPELVDVAPTHTGD